MRIWRKFDAWLTPYPRSAIWVLRLKKALPALGLRVLRNCFDDSKKLIHIVLIEFKSTVSKSDMQLVVDAAYSLQQIEGVEDLNFGENTSPEGLNKGYTHSLTMKFNTAEDRDSVYLPHPIHQKFVKLFVPLTESVLVYDYWE